MNLSTGEREEIYARYDPRELAGEWHDHERVNETHVLVDQVFLVNTETEIVTWLWDAQSDFSVKGGGPYPKDRAHINDVELLADGRVVVSMRNQDQVVFLDRRTGLIRNWTLGSDGDHGMLYEQHNPDYIPAARGGPALVVADSENGRIVEYQRRNGQWTRTWQWRDERMQWPRDADRLPDGHTLIVDTHGKRVLELDRRGEVVWSVSIAHPYDAERLRTGPESASGESAARLDLESRTARQTDGSGDPLSVLDPAVEALLPSRLLNAAVYVTPLWMGRAEGLAAGVGLLTGLAGSRRNSGGASPASASDGPSTGRKTDPAVSRPRRDPDGSDALRGVRFKTAAALLESVGYHVIDPDALPASPDHPCDRRDVAAAAELAQLAAAVYTVDPGEDLATTYHYHERREELLYVLAGSLHVETPDGEYVVDTGEVFAVEPESPIRPYNPGDADIPARVLGVGAPKHDIGRPYDPDGEADPS